MLAYAGLATSSPTARAEQRIPELPSGILHGNAAANDFDGDHRPDFAVAEPRGSHDRYRVEVHLSTRPDTAFFNVDSHAPGGLSMAAFDVDGDHDIDLVISTKQGRRLVGIWINDGHGGFSRTDSAAFPAAVWHVGDRFFDLPEAPVNPASDCGSPAAGWVATHCNRGAPFKCAAMVLPSNLDRPVQPFANPSSSFRAPPFA